MLLLLNFKSGQISLSFSGKENKHFYSELCWISNTRRIKCPYSSLTFFMFYMNLGKKVFMIPVIILSDFMCFF